MKYNLTLFLILTVFSFGHTQRYEQQVFDQVKKSTFTYFPERSLEMDIYSPMGDDMKNRPLVLYVHGGGFAGGKRDEPEIIGFCENLARRGMVVASISYTLTMKGQSFGCNQAASNKLATFRQSAEEINYATTYLLQRADELAFNPHQVVLAGSSAGAEAILHAAYWPETKEELPADFKYGGLISMAGALNNLDYITASSAMPSMFFHGTCDNLVPYGSAPHHYCDEDTEGYLLLHGAKSIAERLKELGIGYYLLTACNAGHEWAGRPFKEYRKEVALFINDYIVNKRLKQVEEILRSDRNCSLVDAPDVCN